MGLHARDNGADNRKQPQPPSKPLRTGKGTSTLPELYRGSWALSDASRGIYERSPSFGGSAKPPASTNGHSRAVIRPIANSQAK
jgi:hypothetical protein